MSEKNFGLMRAVLDKIETVGDDYDQTKWRCGTSRCFAGWAAELAGIAWKQPDFNEDGEPEYRGIVVLEDGTEMHVADWAANELGITGEEEQFIFAASLTVDQIRENIDMLAAISGE